MAQSNDSRLFLKKDGKDFQLLSLNQGKDGSIYASWPSFDQTIWPFAQEENSEIISRAVVSVDAGKLTIHASGLAGFRGHKERGYRLKLNGSPLRTQGTSEIRSVRHLLTFFSDEPRSLPGSQCFNRKGDYLIQSAKEVTPFVILLFAIPVGITQIQISPNFHMDSWRLDDVLGSGVFSLKFHQISWFIYKNKNLLRWPLKPHCFFHDGYHIPFFTGLPNNSASIQYLEPTYQLEDKTLNISWSFPEIPSSSQS